LCAFGQTPPLLHQRRIQRSQRPHSGEVRRVCEVPADEAAEGQRERAKPQYGSTEPFARDDQPGELLLDRRVAGLLLLLSCPERL
jgi:hypothetical protein